MKSVLHDFTKYRIMTPPPAPTTDLCEGSNKPAPIPEKPTKRPPCPNCGVDVGIWSGQMTDYFKAHIDLSVHHRA